ncbi:grpE protein homolog, mitochondrial [Coccinella septempunctata]|uniref:grpE protein homolog, mitochondrial n=1 Tax=Coccinella septempunctata TaxID=41139 RepID=UPI001D06C7A1|nr:grpE protein homolog, mitochondrial [Coccinella septempunctata]
MALRVTHFWRCGKLLNENIQLMSRSLLTSNLRCNTAAEKEKSSEAQAPPVAEGKSDELGDKLNASVEDLNKKVLDLTEKNNDLMDKYKRALADGENMRQRLTKQIADAKIFGIQSFCKDLLDVADVLAKATETVPKNELNEKNPHLKSLYEGLVMTEAQMKTVFKRYGLEPVNPVNEKFDPNYHEALFQQEVEGKEPGTVVVVSKIGYKLHDRVLRPALVGVSK